jgi:hypothetical protein
MERADGRDCALVAGVEDELDFVDDEDEDETSFAGGRGGCRAACAASSSIFAHARVCCKRELQSESSRG